jgi:hypothetical protein
MGSKRLSDAVWGIGNNRHHHAIDLEGQNGIDTLRQQPKAIHSGIVICVPTRLARLIAPMCQGHKNAAVTNGGGIHEVRAIARATPTKRINRYES